MDWRIRDFIERGMIFSNQRILILEGDTELFYGFLYGENFDGELVRELIPLLDRAVQHICSNSFDDLVFQVH